MTIPRESGGETRVVGARRQRRQDKAALRGETTYIDDIAPDGAVHAAVHRSQYSHATVEAVDTTTAAAMDDVLTVLTGSDIQEADVASAIPIEAELPGQKEPPRPVLANDVVRYSGEPVALVLAEDRYRAHDAADAVEVSYDRREAVTDPEEALSSDTPTVHDDFADNSGLDWEFGEGKPEVDDVFDRAAHTVSVSAHNQRLHPDPIETRGMLVEFDAGSEQLDVRMTTQMPHIERGLFANTLGLPEEQITVSAPDVGGGFGVKALPYPEHVLVAWAAIRTERPVKWIATRSESHLADHHGRAFHTEGDLALDEDGDILAFRTNAVMNMGAYMVYPTTPWVRYEMLASGPYEIPSIYGHVRAAFTNTSPVAPYRGAGRPEIIYLIERLVDNAARELDVDPAELRRRNYVPPDEFPYDTPVSTTYDSGDYESALEKALETADYEAWRERQATAREEDRYIGIGVASFVEDTGQDPGVPESGRVAFTGDGEVVAACGTADQGQGHETTFAQLVAEELGVQPDEVTIDEGSTDSVAAGAGTFGSRSVAVGGSALAESAAEVRETARKLAAHHFEAAEEDVTFEHGKFAIEGAPQRTVHIRELAERAASGDYPEEVDADLSATTGYDPENWAFAFGTHIAVVAVDPDTGEVDFQRYVAVDDCGVQINPALVAGQVHGGVAQGIGQALYERAVYDDTGSLTTGSLMDYALPKATQLPDIEVEKTETPAPHNPTGAKGVGEGGAIVAPPTVVNAVVDALEPFGINHIDMPVTQERVWRAVRED
jgi:carbon-monoxide dehydrogenase large subunit